MVIANVRGLRSPAERDASSLGIVVRSANSRVLCLSIVAIEVTTLADSDPEMSRVVGDYHRVLQSTDRSSIKRRTNVIAYQ